MPLSVEEARIETRRRLHVPLSTATMWMLSNEPVIFKAVTSFLSDISNKPLNESLEARQAWNSFLTYARTTAWNQAVDEIANES